MKTDHFIIKLKEILILNTLNLRKTFGKEKLSSNQCFIPFSGWDKLTIMLKLNTHPPIPIGKKDLTSLIEGTCINCNLCAT